MADPQAGANPAAKAKSVGTSPSHIYRAAIDGYAANLSAAQLAKVKADPAVDYVVPGDPLAVSAVGKTPPPPAPAQQAQVVPFPVTRVGGLQSPTAKIDGIDERVNVDVAVLDSGIDVTHPDLNVVGGINSTNGKSFADTGGHGTRVAGTLAAIDKGTPPARCGAVASARHPHTPPGVRESPCVAPAGAEPPCRTASLLRRPRT